MVQVMKRFLYLAAMSTAALLAACTNAWILARTPKLDEATLQALLNRASELGFDRQAFLRTPHSATTR